MCFIIQSKNPVAKIATEDIQCFKMLVTDPFSVIAPYQRIRYWSIFHFGKSVTKTAKMNEFAGGVFEGLHTFSNKNVGIANQIQQGYNCHLYNAIIPKGTKYFYNSDACEYVSEKLIVYKQKIK